ncbi:pentapeptide repeat-containing protein [Flavobacterium sp. HJSW_4]|uniref:pentapeptide repeat-containing protein n=1 Tax=Flavobacterium sp. HJSW_4 TaxID=3344660 RepID=UPI0035F32115
MKKESEYFLDKEYNAIIYAKDDLNFKDFECCVFNNCNFSACTFLAVTFIDCVFNDCIFTEAKINYVAFRTATFNRCEIKDVNFAMCDKLIFEIEFNDCILDFSKFYTLKLKGTFFTNCSLIAVDFMATDLTSVVFYNCDLYRAEFNKAIANKTDFKTSYNYTIDPSKTKLKKAIFSLNEVKGLLFKHDVIVSDNK